MTTENEQPYDGSDQRRCNAKTRSTEDHRGPGTPCRNWAGFRTDHPGVGVCFLHGGRTQAHRTHAVVTEAKRRMVTLGQPIEDVTAPAALTGLLRASAGHVQWLSGEVAALDSLGSHEAEALVKLYDSERDRLARVSEACIRAGVAEAQVRIMEVQATAYVQAIREAAQDAGLSDRQLQALGVALRKRLAGSMADGDPAQVHREQAQADVRLAALRAEQEAEEERRVAERAEHRAKELSNLTFPPEELIPEPPEAA